MQVISTFARALYRATRGIAVRIMQLERLRHRHRIMETLAALNIQAPTVPRGLLVEIHTLAELAQAPPARLARVSPSAGSKITALHAMMAGLISMENASQLLPQIPTTQALLLMTMAIMLAILRISALWKFRSQVRKNGRVRQWDCTRRPTFRQGM
jgi:hypothetical protein